MMARARGPGGGKVIDVTLTEFKLLAAFVAHRGRVLSRQRLLDDVWNDANCVERVVDTHVSNLRKKIEPEPGEPRYLVSVRGLGYRFDG